MTSRRGADRALVIDDDADARDLLRQFLAREGFDVVTAAGGEAGIELARNIRPSLITLDVLMPGLDGWSVLDRLKADPELAAIPVLLVTISDDRSKGLTLGAVELITKPVDRERLRALLARLRASRAGRRVLVVEDDAAMRDWLARTLTGDGWQVSVARDGHEALQCASVVDLVLLDLLMPGMDGFAFLEARQQRADLRAVPVVVLTAKDLTPEDHARLNGEVERVLVKAATERERLIEELRMLLGGLESHATALQAEGVEP